MGWVGTCRVGACRVGACLVAAHRRPLLLPGWGDDDRLVGDDRVAVLIQVGLSPTVEPAPTTACHQDEENDEPEVPDIPEAVFIVAVV
jgi:hypothetical protein